LKTIPNLFEIVETSLRKAALWDEVKDRLTESALAPVRRPATTALHCPDLAVQPRIVLMDEPCAALDPIATSRIEDLMFELKRDYTDHDREPTTCSRHNGRAITPPSSWKDA